MKSIRFFFITLRTGLIRNKLAFFLLFIAIMVSVGGILAYFTSQTVNTRRQTVEAVNGRIERGMSFQLEGSFDVSFFMNLLQKEELSVEDIQFEVPTAFVESPIDMPGTFIASLTPPKESQYLGKYFSEEQIVDEKRVILVPSEVPIEAGESIRLNNELWQVVGKRIDTVMDFEIPFTVLSKLSGTKTIYLLFTPYSDESDYQKVQNYIADNADFSVAHYVLPESVFAKERLSLLFNSSLIFLMAFINFTFVYQYILEKRKQTFSIYRIVGMTKRRLVLGLLLEIVFLYSIGYVAACGLCVVFQQFFLPKLIGTDPVPLFFEDVLFFYGSSLLLLIGGIVLVTLRFARQAPIHQLKESAGEVG